MITANGHPAYVELSRIAERVEIRFVSSIGVNIIQTESYGEALEVLKQLERASRDMLVGVNGYYRIDGCAT